MSKTKCSHVLFAGLLFSLSALKVKAQQEPLNIKQAIDIALAENRSLRSDSFNIAVAGSKTKEVAGLLLPQVNYSNVTEYNPAIAKQLLPGSMVGQPGKDIPVQMGNRYNLRAGVELTKTLSRPDLKLQVAEAGMQTGVAKTRYAMSKEELVYQVAANYYSLQTTAELIRTTRFDYLNMKEVLDIAKAQYENGLLKKIDHQSLEINVANMLSQLNQLQTQYKEQLAYFNYLLGIPAANETAISDKIADELHNTDRYYDLSQRNDIRLLSQQVMIKENELKRIEAEKKPSIQSYFRFNVQSQFNSVSNAFDKDYSFQSSVLGVSVTIPVFDASAGRTGLNQ